MALPLGRDSQPQLIDFFAQLFFAQRCLTLRGLERIKLRLLSRELITHCLKFAIQFGDTFIGRAHLPLQRIFLGP